MSDLEIKIGANPSDALVAFASLRGSVTELNQALEITRKVSTTAFESLSTGIKLLESGAGLHEQRMQFESLAAAHGLSANRIVKDLKEISEGNLGLEASFRIGSKAVVMGLNEADTKTVMEFSKKWAEAAGRPFEEVAEQTTKALSGGKMKGLREMDEMFTSVKSRSEAIDIMRRKMGDFTEVDFSAADKMGAISTSLNDFALRLGEAANGSPEIKKMLDEMTEAAERFVSEFSYTENVEPVVKFLDAVYEKAKSVAGGLGVIVGALGDVNRATGGQLGGAAAAATGGYVAAAAGTAGTMYLAKQVADLTAAANAARAAGLAGTAAAAAQASSFAVPAAAATGAAVSPGAALMGAGAAFLSSPAFLIPAVAAVAYLIYQGTPKEGQTATGPIKKDVPAEYLEQVNKWNSDWKKKEKNAASGELSEEERKEAAEGFKELLADKKVALQDSLRDQEYAQKQHNEKVLESFKDRIEAENKEYKLQTEQLKEQQEERQRELDKAQNKTRSEFDQFQKWESEQVKKTGTAPKGSLEDRIAAFRKQDAAMYGGAISSSDSEEVRAEKFRRQQDEEKRAFAERQAEEKRALDDAFQAENKRRESEREAKVDGIEAERKAQQDAQEVAGRAFSKASAATLRQYDRDAKESEEEAKASGYKNLRLPPGARGVLGKDSATLATGSGGVLGSDAAVVDPLGEILAALRAGVVVSTKGGDRITDEITDLIINRATIRAKLEGTAVAAAN